MDWSHMICMLLLAFSGGAFGAAVGPLLSFSFCGVFVLLGVLLSVPPALAGLASPAGQVDLTGLVAFGVVLGPHVGFGGGAAAAAYVARRAYFEVDFTYHPAKNVTVGWGSRWDILVVGGCFGVLGYIITEGSRFLVLPLDPVALGVVGSALLHRLMFGYSLFGQISSCWWDMRPFDRGQRRADESGRFLVEPWLPYQYRWLDVSLLGVIMGLLGAYLTYVTGNAFTGFGLSVAVLIFLCSGVERIPVTHHMTLPAGTAVLAYAGFNSASVPVTELHQILPLTTILILGSVFGLLGAVSGELLQRLLYAHAETHLDPPAASILTMTLLISCLARLRVLPATSWIASI